MFGNDAEFLTIYRSHAAELQAEVEAARLARSLPRRHAGGWLSRRRQPGRTDAANR